MLGRPGFARASGDALADWRQAFRQHGVQAPLHVQGSFAVGLADDDGTVWLASDRFGVQTVCWRVVDGRIHYAARADDLARVEPQASLDPQALYEYLYFHVIPAPLTVFSGVHRVPAGHCLRFAKGVATLHRYWTPTFEEPATPRFDALASEFRQVVQNAVASQLDGGKPGCFLSGGTDSSTVAGMIGVVGGGPAATYSIGFEAEGYDEMAFARIAARRFGTEHHEYYLTPDDLLRSIPDVARHYDQPFGNSSALPAYYCARMAREDGVTRLLAGDGGDELFGGNARYAKQRLFGFYDRVPPPLKSALVEPALASPLGALPVLRKGRSYVEQARVPLPDRMQMYNLLLRLGPEQVFEPEFLRRVDAAAPLRRQREAWEAVSGASALNRMLAFDWRFTLAETDLPKVCGTTALAGVEVGFPFLDDAVVAFSQRLPTDYKLRGNRLRWFFKEALRGFLPDEILVKKKQGFGLPFGVWTTRHAGLNQMASDALASLATRGIVRGDFVSALLKRLLPEHPGYYGEMVWILLMLEQWLRASPTASGFDT
jgi:asparagine synthase (glutamine-hydrolysing)